MTPRNIGQVKNRILIKSGKQVVLMRAIDGFGVPLAMIESGQIDGVQVTYEGHDYGAPVSEFSEHGVPYQREPYEKQVILPRKYWKKRPASA